MDNKFSYNCNDSVFVRLTERGLKIHRENRKDYPFPYRSPKIDSDGYAQFQLWELMHEFGDKTHIGMDICFETEILLDSSKVKCYSELQSENAALRKLSDERGKEICRLWKTINETDGKLLTLQAAAENILFKRKQGVPLEAVDFEWLERAVGEKA